MYTSHRTHQVNLDFFDTPSNEMAWVLGLIASDGDIVNSLKSWGITMQDKDCLEQVASILDYSGIVPNKWGTRDTYRLSIGSTQMVKSLMDLGLTISKSLTLIYPNISSEYDSHFIRGYFDGDGWFHAQKTQHSTGLYRGQVGITTGSKEFADEVIIRLEKNGMTPHLNIRQPNYVTFPNGITSMRHETYMIRMTGISVVKFYDYIYKDSIEVTRLKRKYDKFNNWYQEFGVMYQGKRLNSTPSKAIHFKEVYHGECLVSPA